MRVGTAVARVYVYTYMYLCECVVYVRTTGGYNMSHMLHQGATNSIHIQTNVCNTFTYLFMYI
jgi:hypothetical protein